MLNDSGSDLDVQRLMHEIRANVASRQQPVETLPSLTPSASQGTFNGNNHYHVNDLLRFHGDEFVRNAYRALLRREPDEAGMAQHLEQLASGRFNKIDVLASLHSSPEGRSSQVKLDGLALPIAVRRLGRLPVVGYVVRLAVAVTRLPVSIQHQNRFEFYTWSQHRSLIAHQDQHYQELRDSLQQISAQMLELTQRTAEQQQANELFARQYEEALMKYRELEIRSVENRNLSAHEIQRLSEQLSAQLRDHQQLLQEQKAETQQFAGQLREELLSRQQQTTRELLMQERRLTVLLEQLKHGAVTPFTPSFNEVANDEEDHLLDALYASLEDQFRGPRDEVRRRLQVYLPFLKEAGIKNGVLDIGCGRGEWLQLLRSEGIEGQGVDRNRVLVEECRGAGLNVVEQDALAYLRNLPDESFNAITTFHLVEHLPFETLIRLLDEIVRTLKPGGILIVETPNPENFMVGSCNFYADPTHRNPIPSETLKFLIESRGLISETVLKLRPWDEAKIAGDDELIKRFNEYFYSAPDYGIVARKP
ncbi:MAG TPA: methyltransferase domain-containing protein [Pyrinomonadaceae bacterium]